MEKHLRSGSKKYFLLYLQAAFLFSAGTAVPAAEESSYNTQAAREMIIGYQHFQADEKEQAAQHLEQALKLDNKSRYLKTVYAEVLYEMQRFKEVIRLLEPLASEDSVDSRVLVILANSCQRQGRIEEAIDYLKRLVKQDHWDEWNRRRLLELLKAQGRYQELIAFYKPLINPQSKVYARDLFQMGALYLKIGGREPAREYLEKALAADSSLADAYMLLGNLDESEGKWSDALNIYLAYLELRPDDVEQVFGRILSAAQKSVNQGGSKRAADEDAARGDSVVWADFLDRLENRISSGDSLRLPMMRVMAIGCEAIGRQERAIEINSQIAAALSDDKFSRRSLLRLFFAAGRFEEMIAVYEQVLDPAEKSYPNDLLQVGVLYLKTGNRESARRYLEKAIEADSELAEAHQILGHLWELEQDPEAALEHYTIFLKLKPEAIRTHFDRLESVSSQIGDKKIPLELMERLVAEGDTSAWAAERLGQLYFHNEQHEKALKILENLKSRGALSDNGYYVLGFVYSRLERFAEAQESFLRVKEARPDYIPICLTLSRVYYAMKEYDKALQVLNEGLEKAPPEDTEIRRELMFSMANVYHEQGDDKNIEAWLKKVLELEPDFAPALNYLGYFYAERGTNLKEAHRLISRALEQEPDNGHYQDSMGWVLFKMGRIEEALNYIKTSLKNLGEHPEVFEHLGDIYLSRGERELARQAWSKSLEINSGNKNLLEKLKKLSGSPRQGSEKQ
jgi:tetratricopeptide (TPR) repeat protein